MTPVAGANKLEWNQGPLSFYTGQSISVTWTSLNIDENVRIAYGAAGLAVASKATLTTHVPAPLIQAGAPSPQIPAIAGAFSVRVLDAATAQTNPINIYPGNSTAFYAINATAASPITIIKSAIVGPNGAALPIITDSLGVVQTATVGNIPVDGMATITWRGVGSAQSGTAVVTLNRGATVLNTASFTAQANMSGSIALTGATANTVHRLSVVVTSASGGGPYSVRTHRPPPITTSHGGQH